MIATPWRAVVAVVLLSAGCVALAHPTPDDAARAGTTVEELERDRDIYVARCSGCHAVPLPSALPPDRWPRVVREMALQAKIPAGDQGRIERFLVTLSAGGPPAANPQR